MVNNFTEKKTKFNQVIWGSKIEFFEKRKSVLKSAQKVDINKVPSDFRKTLSLWVLIFRPLPRPIEI